eukprot:CAMPEP_0174939424 /NCGR_PEP_ID=MMETSP1355-20121228/66558_1 /TAXON_ID=464990 /ORGANISM="Hemiselmis tepida, Strain CCMP443" /LENGTH=81 /DNA_ID=CAMNT_0016186439 /DNA_START=60 /DNA_END=301 /DNA_ORIENTATION=-
MTPASRCDPSTEGLSADDPIRPCIGGAPRSPRATPPPSMIPALLPVRRDALRPSPPHSPYTNHRGKNSALQAFPILLQAPS